VLGAGEFEQNSRALYRKKQVPGRIAGRENLHVARTARVPNIDRIEQDAGIDVSCCHLDAHTIATRDTK
jgi:hypothetical protein